MKFTGRLGHILKKKKILPRNEGAGESGPSSTWTPSRFRTVSCNDLRVVVIICHELLLTRPFKKGII